MKDDTPPLEIDWLKTLGGALAAVTTAVLLSTLGAAGTLIGAALGSIAVTVSTQLYTQGLARSRATMAKAQETALTKVGIAQSEVRRAGRRRDAAAADSHLERADEHLSEARADLTDPDPDPVDETPPSLRERFPVLPWKRILLLAAGTFLLVLLLIGAFEQLAGRSVASYTGGSDRDSGSIVPGSTDRGGEQSPGEEQDRPDDGSKDSEDGDGPESTEGPTPTQAPSSGAPASTPTPSTPAAPSSSSTPTTVPTTPPATTPSSVPSSTPSRAPGD